MAASKFELDKREVELIKVGQYCYNAFQTTVYSISFSHIKYFAALISIE